MASENLPPMLPVKELARQWGMSEAAVSNMVDSGVLPTMNFTEAGKRGKRYVNMVYLQRMAEKQADEIESYSARKSVNGG
ncbi:Uncharacterised protein [Zhongshania aliphaticivorans]|uniref:DNA-binding protein n=1 Tax=Zhongshania aliphaticivorans TaxID=1470434 RepID=A0A5S9N5Y4_9GAMM|nr:hypothetical protein [Zhongshania aliphaticivorans]CAA0081206.1 Uncharacterised protein [Zhongshania aliphaticivorans]CAA0085197.1 Uncharacterised protein [Zhongshania aliphaticivorans]